MHAKTARSGLALGAWNFSRRSSSPVWFLLNACNVLGVPSTPMATPHVLCRPGAVCGISSAGSERLAVTANDGGGVTCYDLSTQRLVQAWATGGPVQDFAAAAVYDAASGCFYAALAPGAAPKARGSTVLAWRVSAEGATLHKLATQLHLPEPVHALLPLEPPQSRGRGQPRGQLDQQRQLGGQQQQTKQQQQEQQLELQ